MVCLLVGVWQMGQHFARLSEAAPPIVVGAYDSNSYEGFRDPPFSLLVLLGFGGLCLRLTDDNPRLFRNVCLTAGVLTLIAYGSWWWTEVLYDEHVIHSFPVLSTLAVSDDLTD